SAGALLLLRVPRRSRSPTCHANSGDWSTAYRHVTSHRLASGRSMRQARRPQAITLRRSGDGEARQWFLHPFGETPRELEALECPFRSQLVSGSARVNHYDGEVTDIRRVPHGGLNAHFERDANNHEGGNPAVALRDVERGAFER